MPSPDATISAAVDRALAILELVALRSGGLTNSEISQRLRIPKSSATYILRALERRGYLQRDAETRKYRLGLKLLDLSHGVAAAPDLRAIAKPILQHLAERAGLTVHLAILDQGQAVYIEKAEASGFIKMDTWVGRRMDVHSTSVGKVLVAWLPRPEVAHILRRQGFKKHTPHTITSLPVFLKELEKVRAHGYAVDNEENNLGARCLAVPVFNGEGKVEASVGVSGTTGQTEKGHIAEIAALVQEATRRISRQLGYHPPPRRG